MDVHFSLGTDDFVRDADKARKNFARHGVHFEEAASVFGDPLFVLTDASRNDEARDAAIGFDSTGRLLYVVHISFEETCIRIISARRTTPKEENFHAQ